MSEVSSSELIGQKVLAARGERLGKVDRVLYQGDRDEPDWAMVKLGWFGVHRPIVPLEHIHVENGQVHVIEERDWVRGAPEVELDGDRMTDEAADRLRGHYGLERQTGLGVHGDIDLPRETRDADPPAMDEGPGHPITERRRERARELQIPSSQPMGPSSEHPAQED